MTRGMIIGNAGGGKSRLSRCLSVRHDLPLYAIDDIFWQPGWVRTPQPDYESAHERFVTQSKWLIDGAGDWPSIVQRLSLADTIIYVDLPLWVHIWWATKRQVSALLFGRAGRSKDYPPLPVTLRLYQTIWWMHKTMRPKLWTAIYTHQDRADIVHIRRVKDLNALLYSG